MNLCIDDTKRHRRCLYVFDRVANEAQHMRLASALHLVLGPGLRTCAWPQLGTCTWPCPCASPWPCPWLSLALGSGYCCSMLQIRPQLQVQTPASAAASSPWLLAGDLHSLRTKLATIESAAESSESFQSPSHKNGQNYEHPPLS